MDALVTALLALDRDGERTTEMTSIELAMSAEDGWDTVDTGETIIVTDIDRTVRADERRLGQFFEHLSRNAVEHGGDDVTVRVGELDHGFYIEDDGPGIPEDEYDDEFDAGYSTSDDETGRGLPFVTAVVDAHGWESHLTDGSRGGTQVEIPGVEFAGQ